MDDKKTGGAAFPDPGRAQSAKQRELLTEKGMTLRDYFAVRAMQSIIGLDFNAAPGVRPHKGETGNQSIARCAYDMADAMLAERAK